MCAVFCKSTEVSRENERFQLGSCRNTWIRNEAVEAVRDDVETCSVLIIEVVEFPVCCRITSVNLPCSLLQWAPGT
jgi:hypothetical protein